MDATWASTINAHLEAHAGYICSKDANDENENAPAVEALLKSYKARACKAVSQCKN
jgi:hypothetical protein